jgi:hypothetical protein
MPEEEKRFWPNLLRAAEAEPRPAMSIRGASGIQHPMVAVGVDEQRRRLLVISGEHDARTAAMAQVDIQAALRDLQVVVARPVALDFTLFAKTLVSMLGRDTFSTEELAKLKDNSDKITEAVADVLKPVLAPLETIGKIPLNALAQWMHALQQLAYINFTLEGEGTQQVKGTVNLRRLADLDPVERDNFYGVCAVPLYSFEADDVDFLNGNPNLDDVRQILKRYDLLQYFFPAPDQLALGLVDRGSTSPTSLLDEILVTPNMGHPHGQMELLPPETRLVDVVDALQERGLLVQGELGLEVGPQGRHIRTSLRFKPREGLLSKIINRFKFSVDLKNLISP